MDRSLPWATEQPRSGSSQVPASYSLPDALAREEAAASIGPRGDASPPAAAAAPRPPPAAAPAASTPADSLRRAAAEHFQRWCSMRIREGTPAPPPSTCPRSSSSASESASYSMPASGESPCERGEAEDKARRSRSQVGGGKQSASRERESVCVRERVRVNMWHDEEAPQRANEEMSVTPLAGSRPRAAGSSTSRGRP